MPSLKILSKNRPNKNIRGQNNANMSDTDEPVIKRLQLNDTNATTSAFSPSSNDQRTSNKQPEDSHKHENKLSNSLMRLNDDCLQHIFNYSDKNDLCQLADICTRMRPMAEQAFRMQNNQTYFDLENFEQPLFRRVLCKFGHLLTSIEVHEYMKSFSFEHSRTVAKYCPRLTELKLIDMKIDYDLKKILIERSKRLHIRSCKFVGDANTMLRNCSKLEYLSISDSHSVNIDFIAVKFPNLVELELLSSYNRYNSEGFRSVLTKNPQLQRLNTRVKRVKHFSAIAQCGQNLEQLEINCDVKSPVQTKDLLWFSRLTKLKKLVFRGNSKVSNMLTPLLTAFLRGNVILEHLDLAFFCVDSDDIKTITKFKTLTTLKLANIDCDSDDNLVSLATELPFLTELWLLFNCEQYFFGVTSVRVLKDIVKAGKHLDSIQFSRNQNLKIYRSDYNELLDASLNRLNPNKLTIKIWRLGSTATVYVPQDIQEKNKHQLEIIFE